MIATNNSRLKNEYKDLVYIDRFFFDTYFYIDFVDQMIMNNLT